MQNQYDLVIIGGGLIGLSLMISLKHLGLRILVLDKKPFPESGKQVFSANSYPISLSHISHVILKAIGIWPKLSPWACPIQRVHVCEKSRFGYSQFESREFGLNALGYVIPQAQVLQEFIEAVHETPFDFKLIEQIETIHNQEESTEIQILSGNEQQKISTQLLIAADGAQSICRKLLNIKADAINRGEEAWVASLEFRGEHDNTALERFTAMGPLAFLPALQKNRGQVVWSLASEPSLKMKSNGENAVCEELQTYLGNRFGLIHSVSHTQFYPLQFLIAEEQIRPGVVLLGNSAHTLSPITAQGFNLGLRDVAALAEIIFNAQMQKKPLGALEYLNQYLNWRIDDQKKVIEMTRKITDVFGLELPGINHFRGLGLLACDIIKPLKKRLGKRMMGMGGPLPRLARGIALVQGS